MSTTFSDIDLIDVNEGDLSQILGSNGVDLFQFDSLAAIENASLAQDGYAQNDYGTIKQEEIPDGNEAPVGNNLGQPFIISTEEYSGPYQFDVIINTCHGVKSPWVYSDRLKKLFILMTQVFPIDFKWIGGEDKNLFVRATPVFSAQYQHEMVTRCIPHAQSNDKSNAKLEPHVWDHIMRCRNPNAVYMGSKETNTHLSVVVPLDKPQAGSDTVRNCYEFACKNSCQTGMNRRQLEVIFTLEDVEGNVLGRKTLNIRVCSCPKRDRDKEEKEYRSDVRNNPPPQTKKRKLEKPLSFTGSSVDTKEYEVKFKIMGKHNIPEILNQAIRLMAADMMMNSNAEPAYKKCIHELQKLITNGNLSN